MENENPPKKSPKRKRASGKWLGAMAVVSGVAVGALALSVFLSRRHSLQGDAAVGQMATTRAGAAAPSSGTGKSGPTSRYNREVSTLNGAQAKRAITTGKSFVPTPVARAAPISLPNLNTPGITTQKPAPRTSGGKPNASAPIIKTAATPPPVSVAGNREDPTGKFMDTVMTQWMRSESPQVLVWQVVRQVSKPKSSSNLKIAKKVLGVEPKATSPLRVGHIYYAVNLLAANSDQPGTPILAEVVAGPMTGARFIGGFKTENNRLLLEFSEVVVHGNVWKIAAFGVDPSTAQPSLASSVDYHYLARWGGLVAASFLEGFGRAVQQSGTTMTQFAGGNGISTVYSSPSLNTKAETEIAIGKVGQKLGQQLDRGINRPATVYLRKGVALGVLVLKNN
jgi:intracellular multiplication protein IcmE